MASLIDWITEEYGRVHGGAYAQLMRKIKHSISDEACQVLSWDAEICTLGEDSTPIEEALNDACKSFKSYFSIKITFFDNLFEEWKFYQFATTWVVRIEREGAPCVMAVLVSEEFKTQDAKGYLV